MQSTSQSDGDEWDDPPLTPESDTSNVSANGAVSIFAALVGTLTLFAWAFFGEPPTPLYGIVIASWIAGAWISAAATGGGQ